MLLVSLRRRWWWSRAESARHGARRRAAPRRELGAVLAFRRSREGPPRGREAQTAQGLKAGAAAAPPAAVAAVDPSVAAEETRPVLRRDLGTFYPSLLPGSAPAPGERAFRSAIPCRRPDGSPTR